MITATTKIEITKKYHSKYFTIFNQVYSNMAFAFLIDFYIPSYPLWEMLDIILTDKQQEN